MKLLIIAVTIAALGFAQAPPPPAAPAKPETVKLSKAAAKEIELAQLKAENAELKKRQLETAIWNWVKASPAFGKMWKDAEQAATESAEAFNMLVAMERKNAKAPDDYDPDIKAGEWKKRPPQQAQNRQQ